MESFINFDKNTFPKFKGSREYIVNHIIHNNDSRVIHSIIGQSVNKNGELIPKKIVLFNEIFKLTGDMDDRYKTQTIKIINDSFTSGGPKDPKLTENSVNLFKSESGQQFVSNKIHNNESIDKVIDNKLQKYQLKTADFIQAYNLISDFKDRENNLDKFLSQCTTKKYYVFGSPVLDIKRLEQKISDHVRQDIIISDPTNFRQKDHYGQSVEQNQQKANEIPKIDDVQSKQTDASPSPTPVDKPSLQERLMTPPPRLNIKRIIEDGPNNDFTVTKSATKPEIIKKSQQTETENYR